MKQSFCLLTFHDGPQNALNEPFLNITPAWWNVRVQDYASVEALDGASLGAAITAAGMLDWSGARHGKPFERLSLLRASMNGMKQTEATFSVPFMLPVIGIKTTGHMAVISFFGEALLPAGGRRWRSMRHNHIAWHESGASGSTGLSDRTEHVMWHESSTFIPPVTFTRPKASPIWPWVLP